MPSTPKRSLYARIILLFCAQAIILSLSIILYGLGSYRQANEQHYVRLGQNLALSVAAFIDGDALQAHAAYGGQGQEGPGAVSLSTLEAMHRVYDDCEPASLYILRPGDEGVLMLFGTSSTDDTRFVTGRFYPWSANTAPHRDSFLRGESVGPVIGNEGHGYLLSVYEPILCSGGEVAAYVGVDLSMAEVQADFDAYMALNIILTLFITVGFMGLSLTYLRRHYIQPINDMVRAADDFLNRAPRRNPVISSIEALDINTGDELEQLASSLKSMEKRTREYIQNLSVATFRAETDDLTGLLNRCAFEQKVNLVLAASQPEDLHAFILIDADNFKRVNDTFGHACGDRVLAKCAAVIRRVFRSADLVARYGGDEFAVFCANTGGPQVAERKARQLCAAWHGITLPDGCPMTASVGVALWPLHGADYASLFSHADAALYRVKNGGRNGFALHTGA